MPDLVGLDLSKAAIWQAIRADPTIMNRSDQRGPFYHRLPLDPPLAVDKAAVVISAGTALPRGRLEDHTISIDVYAYSADLVSGVAADLDRLFHQASLRVPWRTLAVTAGVARIRRESSIDVPDPASELEHKTIRFRILFAPALAS